MSYFVVDDPKIQYRTPTGWLDAYTGAFKAAGAFPTHQSVGVNALPGWTPKFELTDQNMTIGTPGAVVEDFTLTNGTILVQAPHVTIRRAHLTNATIINEYRNVIYNGLLVEDVTFESDPPGKWQSTVFDVTILPAGYTARRCSVYFTNEGFHTGGSALPLADPDDPLGRTVRLYDCVLEIIGPSDSNGNPCVYEDGSWIDWHGDCVQAEDARLGGVPLKIRNVSARSHDREPACGASSCIFLNTEQSLPADIDRLLLSGGGFALHAECGGNFTNVFIDQDRLIYGPVSVLPEHWSLIGDWEVFMAEVDWDIGQPAAVTGRIPRGYPGYGPPDPL